MGKRRFTEEQVKQWTFLRHLCRKLKPQEILPKLAQYIKEGFKEFGDKEVGVHGYEE